MTLAMISMKSRMLTAVTYVLTCVLRLFGTIVPIKLNHCEDFWNQNFLSAPILSLRVPCATGFFNSCGPPYSYGNALDILATFLPPNVNPDLCSLARGVKTRTLWFADPDATSLWTLVLYGLISKVTIKREATRS